MGPRERADTIAKRPQIPVLLSLISCPSEAKSSLPCRFLSVLPREINYVTTHSFPNSSKGTLASSFSAQSLPGETDYLWRGEDGKENQEKRGHLSTGQEWRNGVVGVTICPRLHGTAGVPGTSCWSQEYHDTFLPHQVLG